jgi:hypothetical protein
VRTHGAAYALLANAIRRMLHLLLFATAFTGCATKANNGLFDPETTTVVLETSSDPIPAPAPGSTCTPFQAQYTYAIANATVSWSVCAAPTPDGVYNLTLGQVTLSATQISDLDDALQGLQLSSLEACDTSALDVYTFTTQQGAMTYDDTCMQGDEAVQDAIYTITGH